MKLAIRITLQEQLGRSPLNISQRVYLIAQSLRFTTRSLFILYIGMVSYLSIGVYDAYVNEDVEFFKVWLPFTIVMFTPFLIWRFIRARRSYQSLKQWKDDYVEQAYIIVFDTTIPKGNTTGERVLSLAKAVFPELTPAYIDTYADFVDRARLYLKRKFRKSEQEPIPRTLDYKGKSYSVDLALKTEEGYFIVKDFGDEIVSIESLRDLVEVVGSKFKDKYQRTNVFRLVCVAKEYSQTFLDSLEEIMTKQLKSNFGIDLLIQEKVGYSVLWVS